MKYYGCCQAGILLGQFLDEEMSTRTLAARHSITPSHILHHFLYAVNARLFGIDYFQMMLGVVEMMRNSATHMELLECWLD